MKLKDLISFETLNSKEYLFIHGGTSLFKDTFKKDSGSRDTIKGDYSVRCDNSWD